MRPWRLTRRARVEMESALARLRGDVVASGVSGTCAAASWVMQAGVTVGFRCWEHDYGSTRILRARVALALRAALRADEDARCEEAYMRVFLTGRLGYYGETSASNDGAWRAVEALREWPIEKRDEAGRVPRALWEAR